MEQSAEVFVQYSLILYKQLTKSKRKTEISVYLMLWIDAFNNNRSPIIFSCCILSKHSCSRWALSNQLDASTEIISNEICSFHWNQLVAYIRSLLLFGEMQFNIECMVDLWSNLVNSRGWYLNAARIIFTNYRIILLNDEFHLFNFGFCFRQRLPWAPWAVNTKCVFRVVDRSYRTYLCWPQRTV